MIKSAVAVMFDEPSLLLIVRFCFLCCKGKEMREKKKGKLALLKTTEDFAERTSIHGIAYVFDRGLWIADRLLWAVLVLSFLGLAFYLTWNSWTQWRDEQV